MHLVRRDLKLELTSLQRLYSSIQMDLGNSRYDLSNGFQARALIEELSRVLDTGVKGVAGFDAQNRMFAYISINGRRTLMVEYDSKVYGMYIADEFT